MDKVDNNFATVQYSPLDMAEYVFWTGDEKGVSMSIEEFLQEGLVSFYKIMNINLPINISAK